MYCLTDRLVIRSFRAGDVAPYWAIVRDPRVVRFFANGRPHCYWEASAYVQDCIARDRASGITRYAVVLRDTRELIGFSGFKRIGSKIDFGYRFARRFWGMGMATEAGRCVLEHGRTRLALERVTARVARDNTASASVLRKLGFSLDDEHPTSPANHLWFALDLAGGLAHKR
jgi:RimJ/RimL family protein N-acetyltransferase